MAKWTSVLAICGILSQSVHSWAQGSAPRSDPTAPPADATVPSDSTSAPAAPPPDVVLTKSGGMVRGTISEKDPGGDVTIQTASGLVRRFSMRDVTYAGPADGMPQPSKKNPKVQKVQKVQTPKKAVQPVIRVKAGEAPLDLRANRADVTFHLKTGSANFTGTGTGWSGGGAHTVAIAGTTQAYSVICTAPCEAILPTGTHRMALSLEGGDPVEDDESVTLRGPARVSAKYTSRKGLRIVGGVAGVAGLLGGTVIGIVGAKEDDSTDSLLLGTGVMVIGIVFWLTLGLQPDVAEIDVQDANVTPRKRNTRRASTTRVHLSPAGLLF